MRLLELDLGAATMHCTIDEVAVTFARMLREMQAAAAFIPVQEREVLRQIMSQESGTLKVSDVFPDFARDSAAHVTLRRLRTAQFILPAGRDMWDRDERIAIKPFAQLVWDRLGEEAIFGPAPKPAHTEPEEEIDLTLPEVNEPDAEETVRVKGVKNKAAAWDDDDVMDFLSESKSVVG
jgi:hypothetical protein